MLLTAGFWQECCEISSQAWLPLGLKRKHSLRACLLFKCVPLGLHFTSALNTWPDRVLHCKLGGVSLITTFPMVHAWDLSSIRTSKSSKPMAPFHNLNQLTKNSKPAWEAQLPEGSWSNRQKKTNKNNYREICEACQGQHKHADPLKLWHELGEVGLACLQDGRRSGPAACLPSLGSLQTSWCLGPLPNPLLMWLTLVDQTFGPSILSSR